MPKLNEYHVVADEYSLNFLDTALIQYDYYFQPSLNISFLLSTYDALNYIKGIAT